MNQPGTPARLSFVTLGAHDHPALRRFYVGVGFEDRTPHIEDFASFLLGGVVLALYPFELLALEAAPGDVLSIGECWNGVTLACNVNTKEEVDGAWQHWVDAGATPIHEPVDRPVGVRSGYVADPEGNRWEIAWAPGMEFDGRGAVSRFGS